MTVIRWINRRQTSSTNDRRPDYSAYIMHSIAYIPDTALSTKTSSLYSPISISVKTTRPNGSRMMPPPDLQIYLRPHVTLTFDLLTPKLAVSCPCPPPWTNLEQNRFICFQNIALTLLIRDQRTDREQYMLLPTPSLDWQRHK